VLFLLKKGKFSITSGFIKYPENLPTYIESKKLIIHLSRNLTEEEVNRKITDISMVYIWSFFVNQDLITKYMNEREKEIYSMVDGVNKVSDIVVKLHFDKILKNERPFSLPEDEYESEQIYKETELEVKRTLYGFMAAGIIRKKKPVKKPENILDRILSYLETKSIKDTLTEV
jgi:hypothetical protein